VTASSAGSRICRWLGIRCSCGAGPALPLPPGRLRAGDLLPDTSRLAGPGASTTRRCARFVLRRLVVDRAMVAAVARELGRSWDTINTIACEATTDLLATVSPTRLDRVRVIGVDEHRWAHTRHAAGERLVTVIAPSRP
jgi:transposase